MDNSRRLVYKTLLKIEQDGAFSNLAIDSALKQSDLSAQDKAFASALFYGVCERKITLDFIIGKLSSVRLSKMDLSIKVILRMGIYQLLYMESVTDFAAVDESVKLALYAKRQKLKGFVNAILRTFIREGKQIKFPDKAEKPSFYLSIKYSCPEDFAINLIKDYGFEMAEVFLAKSLDRPPLTIRANTLKTTADSLRNDLQKEGVECRLHEKIENCVIIDKTTAIDRLQSFKQGLFHVQDSASMLCAMALAPNPDDLVYDICSAPGGKTFTMAQLMEGKGKIGAFDLYEHKIKLIQDGANRLGLSNVEASINDATKDKDLDKADKILCDVVCSGSGIIRRKPEIKYKEWSDLSELVKLQLDILTKSAKHLKSGGELVYSTCSVNKAENEGVVKEFLQQNSDFEPCDLPQHILEFGISNSNNMVTLMPNVSDTDGFFIAKLRRK
ncbi:MAG: 16S rRNA (cytosine(967)-C(5))-methyltransferase RsmB [Oscillospiraceae bacterium]|nr:16S rRNA (cytosine(967)-C(5))-methyltransferase RsmB [Oscillospiraceae bacterium]